MSSGVYLIHFETPIAHARHYLGSAAVMNRRLKKHQRGGGARLMEIVRERGIPWVVARLWYARDLRSARVIERKLKRQHGSTRLCPLCRAERRAAR